MNYFTHAQLKNNRKGLEFARNALIENAKKDAGHGLIWSLFSDDPQKERDFLFRETREGHFLIVSHNPPKFDDNIWEIKTKPYQPSVQNGQRFGFALRVNPTKAIKIEGYEKSKRIDVLMHAKKQNGGKLSLEDREEIGLEWLAQKLAREGAKLEKEFSQILQYSNAKLLRKDPNLPPKERFATFSFIDVEGVLEVTDANLFQNTLLNGIGHGKAFGLGLLLLRPLG